MSPTQFEDRQVGLTSGRATKRGFYYGYVVVAAVFILWMIGLGTYSASFAIFLKPVLAEFGWSRAEAALGFSLSVSVTGALGILMGWLTDRLGPRIVITIVSSLIGVCYLLLSQVNAVWQFQLYFATVGAIGMSAVGVPAMATLARWFVRRRGLMTGIAQSGVGLGGLIFPLLTGWLIVTYGWRSAYSVLAIIALAGTFVAGMLFKRAPADTELPPDETFELNAPEAKKKNSSLQAAGFSLREAIRTRQFWIIAGLYFSFGFGRSTFTAHIPSHVQDLGFSLANGANVLAAITVASIIGRIWMGRIADATGARSAFMISFAATAVSLIWGLVTKDMWGFYLFALIFGFGWGAQAVLRYAVTTEAFGLVSLGLIMGILHIAESAASTLGTYFAAYIFDITGNYYPAFWTGIAISIMGIVLAWRLKPVPNESDRVSL